MEIETWDRSCEVVITHAADGFALINDAATLTGDAEDLMPHAEFVPQATNYFALAILKLPTSTAPSRINTSSCVPFRSIVTLIVWTRKYIELAPNMTEPRRAATPFE